MDFLPCAVCKLPARVSGHFKTRRSDVRCFRCGEYSGDDDSLSRLRRTEWSDQQIANASGYIRRNPGIIVTKEQAEHLAILPTPPVIEKSRWLLMAMGRENETPGIPFLDPFHNVEPAIGILKGLKPELATDASLAIYSQLPQLKWLSISSVSNTTELHWLIHDCLIQSGHLIKTNPAGFLSITLQGWQEIERLKQINSASRLGFVAMSFREDFLELFQEGIAPGIEAAGYEARRVDRIEHNNRIDDEIVANIRMSRFLVGDFTVNRGGIYFEAGFALGLGLPVIWLVREKEIDEVHFDNRQYNFIKWKDGGMADLAQKLRFRIEATIGRGPMADPL